MRNQEFGEPRQKVALLNAEPRQKGALMEHRIIELSKGTFCSVCGESMYAAGPECVPWEAREDVLQKVRQSEGRLLVVWTPEDCAALKDLLRRLKKVE